MNVLILECLVTEVAEFPVTVLIADVSCYVAIKYGIQQHSACLYWLSLLLVQNVHVAKEEKPSSHSFVQLVHNLRCEDTEI